jgi:hypothetical protein
MSNEIRDKRIFTERNSSGTSGVANTTNATVTTIETIPIPTSTVLIINSEILARVTGGSNGYTGQGCLYSRAQAFRNIAGVVTAIGTISAVSKEDIALALYDVIFTISGTNVLIQVNSQANDNTTWKSTTKVNIV